MLLTMSLVPARLTCSLCRSPITGRDVGWLLLLYVAIHVFRLAAVAILSKWGVAI